MINKEKVLCHVEGTVSWTRLNANELIAELDKSDQKDSPTGVLVALVQLVREGKAVAYRLPDGEIRYQYCKEEKEIK